MNCELCTATGGVVLWEDAQCRVVLADEAGYCGFCRVIWNTHVREMTDLDAADQTHCMKVVFTVERVLRKTLSPVKINLASLGNMVAHIHWHVIPRFADDPHFPLPVWGSVQRKAPERQIGTEAAMLARGIAAELKA